MEQPHPPPVANLLKAIIILQLLTIAAVIYLVVTRGEAGAPSADEAKYQQSVAEYKKSMDEYREVTAKYQAALDEWKKLPDYKTAKPQANKSPETNAQPGQ